MGVKIKPVSTIVAGLGMEPDGRVQSFFTETCYKAMDKYVPKRNGDLRTVVVLGKNYITYESEYAEYQYYGEREDGSHKVYNYTTPGTGSYWDKRMISADMDSVVKQVQDYVRR